MPVQLAVVAPQPMSGKTAIAVGLAQKLRSSGKSVSLARLGEGGNAEADAALFAGLPGLVKGDAEVTLIECPSGDASVAPSVARVIAVVPAGLAAAGVASYVSPVKDRLAGVVVNLVPARRADALRAAYREAGIEPLAMVPEDRLLAAPVLGEVAEALGAQSQFLNGNALRPIDRPLIAPISADPGQGYFARNGVAAVIVRSDKPDLQLAALNAGATCLIVTGGLPILSYVLDRVEEDEIPLLRTELETIPVVERIESLFSAAPFAGGEAKVRRIAELLEPLNVSAPL